MQPLSVFALMFGAVAFAIPFPSDVDLSEHQQVQILAAPTHVVFSEPAPAPPAATLIPVSEVLKSLLEHPEGGLVQLDTEATPGQDRMDFGGDGWGMDPLGLGKKLKKFFKGEEDHGWEQPAHGPGLVGPFAFQLGAYYNPYIPMPIPISIPAPPPAPAAPPCYPCDVGHSAPSYGQHQPMPSYGLPPPY